MDPQAHWNSSKDRSLWKILSSASKGSEIDCESHLVLIYRYLDSILIIFQGINCMQSVRENHPRNPDLICSS